MFQNYDRRRFLRLGAACGAAVLAPRTPYAWAADADASDLVAGKNGRLIVHNTKVLELETPLELLRDQKLSPKSLLFMRNNQELAGSRTIQSSKSDEWQFDIAGMIENPRTVKLETLREMDQTEVEMVLQCSGNGRAHFSTAAAVKGSPWKEGAVGNVRFSGVPLKALFDSLALGLAPDAHYLTAEGKDGPPKPDDSDFEHSIPLADALTRSLVALKLNGEPIPAVHGGPVRLVTPGYYGTMQIKWLSRLRLETRETFNHHQRRRYRTPHEPIAPGSDFTYDFDNSDANWRMLIKSIIFEPLDGEKVKPGNVAVRGVAFNDGEAKVDTVEVSTDDGRTWQRTQMERPDSPYAWYRWSTKLSLNKGRHRIMARAIDALGRSQPLDGTIAWNPAGYGWNGVQRVEVEVG